MRSNIFTLLLALSLSAVFSDAAVTQWRADKGKDYLQTADNTEPVVTTNWYFYGEVGTSETNDAASVVLTGGNIAGSIALIQEDEDRWELYVGYASKAELDAVFPSDDNYSLILNGGALGTVTQTFNIGSDGYPMTPYLTGGDFSACQVLDVMEPLELNWISTTGLTDSVYLEVLEGPLLGDGDTVFDDDPGTIFASLNFPVEIIEAGSNYTGFLQFANFGFTAGNGGFGVDGVVSFNTEVLFPIVGAYRAVDYDDFNDNSMDVSKWNLAFPPEEAPDTFTETNGRLEYTSAGTGDTFVAWFWDESELSYTQDWAVAIDITDTIPTNSYGDEEEIYFGILVMADGTLSNNISLEFIGDDHGHDTGVFASSGDIEVLSNSYAHIDASSVGLKISFDADTKLIHTAYSTGGDYTVQTNFSATSWGMTDSSVFNPLVFCGNELTEVTNGQTYADNFRIYGESPISNEVSLIELEYNRDYEFPDSPTLDRKNWYKLDFETSHRVETLSVHTAAGDIVEIIGNESIATGLEWYFETTEPITTPWDPANDGDWTITLGYNDGTFQSTIVPFSQTNGAAIPVIEKHPLFTSQGGLDGFVANATELDVSFNAADTNANFMHIDEFPENEDGEIRFYADSGLPDVLGVIPTIHDVLSATNDTIEVVQGTNWWLLTHGWGRTDYNDEGVGYIVVKQTESDVIFIITADADNDSMDDDWEIDFFGGTNVVDGGAFEDFDGDGMLNIEEFIAGVNPTNDGSVFEVEEPGPSPAGFVINWNSVPGREYAVYWAKSLTNSFISVTPGYLPYPRNSYTDEVHTVEGCGFYYIDVQLDD